MIGPADIPLSFTIRPIAEPGGDIQTHTTRVFTTWCGTLGPGTTVLWNRLARLLMDQQPAVSVADLAAYTGMSPLNVRQSLARLINFGRAELDGGVIRVLVVTLYPKPRRNRVPNQEPTS